MKLDNATSQGLRRATAALCLVASASVFAAKSHQHGVAQLDIGVDPGRVTLLLEMPLDSVVGFERAPRTDDERRQVEAALAQLRDLAALVRIDPAAQCTPGGVTLQSAVLGLGSATSAAPASKEGHADIEATADFICKEGGKAGFVELGLFEAFPRLQRVDVQTATRRGQMKATLKRPERRVPLAR
jgi:hypothetical protein